MNANLLDLSAKIDEQTCAVYEAIATVAVAHGIPFFVVGATARDVILVHGYGLSIKRMTEDVDFGVQVSSWEQYMQLTSALIETGQFTKDAEKQRLIYQTKMMVDIVPFGPISSNNQTITWPPEQAVEMSVQGFEDAYRHAQLVRLKVTPELIIPFASPAGLAIMKMIAWRDRGPALRVKDALDLAYLMRTYADANNLERLYEQHADLLTHHDFALEPSGAGLLGRDIAIIASPKTRDAILKILAGETGEQAQYRLVEDMVRTELLSDNAFDDALTLLEALKLGIKDTVN